MSVSSKDYGNVTNIVGQITIRPAVVADADAIARVRVESWRASYRGIVPDAYLDSMKTEDSSRLWARVLGAASDAACTFVAEVDGEVVGFAAGITLAEPKLDFDAELTALYLLPSVQRAGIGRRLLVKVAATLAAAGAPDMLVWVLAQNRKARDFFEGLGAQLLAEQTFNWDELDLVEVAYGWTDIASIVASGTPSLAQ
ncbi:ribosomal protein S18 acetylase RimI-like enzyme [Herbaspirillum sp. Sphag1AN]|uniref:GNAT family N-acetyltransferase n=1 Tax=unclassified Herbaspirillum TaxID=2624150 RepID=UPI00161F5175|nr:MULTISPECIES: GNAT family N-acetyltransferase [unclassified Herbaspirillum]MBB3211170.1 ribosomal protein S18 acetylase RimI-like enzyme [Herbaspirillum sp. Sphag1AN]MBB3244799.1 ribosomal protein S18 acetylase RimI-like enzyme [Herbaspirillum sp. Sphag64]